mmetsp:Transcript_685/g.2722  ORF Transcript_685/g.2722 Transcript_685/m.2722 type:complete len:344 (-) Transcript_685:139-1170(-)
MERELRPKVVCAHLEGVLDQRGGPWQESLGLQEDSIHHLLVAQAPPVVLVGRLEDVLDGRAASLGGSLRDDARRESSDELALALKQVGATVLHGQDAEDGEGLVHVPSGGLGLGHDLSLVVRGLSVNRDLGLVIHFRVPGLRADSRREFSKNIGVHGVDIHALDDARVALLASLGLAVEGKGGGEVAVWCDTVSHHGWDELVGAGQKTLRELRHGVHQHGVAETSPELGVLEGEGVFDGAAARLGRGARGEARRERDDHLGRGVLDRLAALLGRQGRHAEDWRLRVLDDLGRHLRGGSRRGREQGHDSRGEKSPAHFLVVLHLEFEAASAAFLTVCLSLCVRA